MIAVFLYKSARQLKAEMLIRFLKIKLIFAPPKPLDVLTVYGYCQVNNRVFCQA